MFKLRPIARRARARWALTLAIGLAMQAAATPAARADEDGGEAAEPETSWYGWQSILSDVTAIGLWTAAGVLDEAKHGSSSYRTYEQASSAALIGGFLVYALGSPTLHGVRGHSDKFAKSLGLRFGLPVGGAIAGMLVGAAIGDRGGDGEISLAGALAILAFFGGGLTAMIVDAAVLSNEPVSPTSSPGFQPAFVPAPGGGTLMFGGRF